MPTLKEIKGRIASVKSTLKITSAMKLVSSAKLRKAQKAIEAMRPYEEQLQRMLLMVQGTPAAECGELPASSLPQAIVAIASNSSLCGGFNANAIAKVREVRKAGDVVYSIGRKMADAMRKEGPTLPSIPLMPRPLRLLKSCAQKLRPDGIARWFLYITILFLLQSRSLRWNLFFRWAVRPLSTAKLPRRMSSLSLPVRTWLHPWNPKYSN